MNLRTNIDGHMLSARLSPTGYADAAVSGTLAGLEVQIEGEVTISDATGTRPSVLGLSMTPERMRQLVTLLADKTGMPAFTVSEWLRIAAVLHLSTRTSDHALADRIVAAYEA